VSNTELKQRLAAILAADVAGYSRLMAADERATVAALDAARAVFRTQIESSQGRVVDMAGDSVLAVFESATGAVGAALAIQDALEAAANALPEDRRMRFRIGVHLGDVIEKSDGTVYGDGVNIAARLEGIAEPGGITVSDAVRAALGDRIAAAFKDLGEHAVKNIAQPVRAFELRAGASSAVGSAMPTPAIVAGKPTVAVLAFDNMSGDPGQDYFCDGVAEDIITDLSKINGLAVVGRQSSFAYKGKHTDLRRVGRELGVRYVLEGSIRTSGNRVRVNAQLIEADAGTHVWANRYDRDVGDAFLMGDEIAEDIVTALDVKLAGGEEARVWRKAVKSPAAREAFFRGQAAYWEPSPANMRRARECFLEAIRLEPDSAQGHASAAATHVLEVMFGWSRDVRASLADADRLATRALELDLANAGGHYVKGMIALFNGLHQEALDEGRQALEIRPMCSGPRAGLAYMEVYSGKLGPAIKHAQEAITLNPVFPGWYLYVTAAAEYFGGRPEQTLATLDRVLETSPGLVLAKVLRVAALQSLGRSDEARVASREILGVEPDLSAERLASTQPFQDAAKRDHYLAVLRDAGLFVG
jgi:adenylate cyclase